MAIRYLDNLDIQKQAPNVERDLHDSVAAMAAYNENYLPDVFEANVKDTGKRYRFNRNNTVDGVTGKWREVGDGGSGGDYATKDDIKDFLPKDEIEDTYAKIEAVEATYATKADIAHIPDNFDDFVTDQELAAELEKILKQGLHSEIVDQLPVDDISTNTMYLIKEADADNYIQWMYIKDKWANLGSTKIDLSMIGNLQALETLAKDTLVNAINELKKRLDDADLSIAKIGELNDLSTQNKADLVQAINEVDGAVKAVDGKVDDVKAKTDLIGDLDDLNTDSKDSLVNAINSSLTMQEAKLQGLAKEDEIALKYATKDEIADFITEDALDGLARAEDIADEYATRQEVADTYATKNEIPTFNNKDALDNIADDGNGDMFLADDGTYKQLPLKTDGDGSKYLNDRGDYDSIKAIVDVNALPDTDIDESVIYRVKVDDKTKIYEHSDGEWHEIGGGIDDISEIISEDEGNVIGQGTDDKLLVTEEQIRDVINTTLDPDGGLVATDNGLAVNPNNVADIIPKATTEQYGLVKLDKYSTEEVKTNKVWIDNKPIYRKVVILPNNLVNGTSLASLGITNVHFMTKIEGYGYDKGYTYRWIASACTLTRNLWVSQDYTIIYTDVREPQIFTHLIFEYTKTTD